MSATSLSSRPEVLSIALLPIIAPGLVAANGFEDTGRRLGPAATLGQQKTNKVITVVVPLSSGIFAEPKSAAAATREDAHVVVVIPSSILLQAEIDRKALTLDLAFPNGFLKKLNDIEATKLTVPIPIGDLIDLEEAIIVASPIAASIEELASKFLSTQSQATSSKEDDHEDKLMASAPSIFSRPEGSATMVPTELLTFINAVVSAPEPTENAEFVLRYYNREEGSRNEYPYDSDWRIVDSEPVVALVDAHVLFAQECLARILAQSKIAMVRLSPPTTSTSSLTQQSPPPSTASTTLPSPPIVSAELPERAVMLLRPVRLIIFLFKKNVTHRFWVFSGS